MTHKLRSSQGATLVMSLIVLLIAVLLVGGILRNSVFGKSMAAREYQATQAYYVAESGLNFALTNQQALGSIHKQIFEDGLASAIVEGDITEPSGGNAGGTFEVRVTPTATAGVFLFESLGRTPYGTQLASASVSLVSIEQELDGANFYLGDPTVDLTFYNNAGGGVSDEPVNWHFADGVFQVIGNLTATSHNRRTFNIWNVMWGTGSRIRGTQPVDEFVADHPWLAGKYELGSGGVPPIAEALRQTIETKIPAGAFTEVQAQPPPNSSLIHAFAGTQASPTAMKARYEGVLGSAITIKAAGVLEIVPTSISKVIGRLELLGDLILLPKTTISIADFESNGHRLYLLSDHNVLFAANPANTGSSTWTPFPFNANNRTYQVTLGHGSIIWAEGDLIFEGQVKPHTPAAIADTESGQETVWVDITNEPQQKNRLFVPTSVPEVAVNNNNWGDSVIYPPRDNANWNKVLEVGTDVSLLDDPVRVRPTGQPGEEGFDPGWGTLAIVSNSGQMRFHLFKSRGILYSGGSIVAYRLRLDGLCVIKDPTRPGVSALGLGECYVTGTPSDALDELGASNLYAQLLARLR